MIYEEVEDFLDKFDERYPDKNIELININQRDISFRDFFDYLSAIDYKFDCCKIYLDKITCQYNKDLRDVQANLKDILNLKLSVEFISWIDCFLFETKSCLDIISHIINLIYGIGINQSQVNFYSVLAHFPDTRNTFFLELNNHKIDWIDQMNKYRKFITHHKLLTTGSNIHGKHGGGISFSPHTLPDDPNTSPRSSRLKIDLKDFFEKCQQNLLKIILSLYKEMETLL